MSIITRLLGRKHPTTANLSLELETKKAALADAERRIEAASAARQAAIERQEKAALILADAAKLDAEQDVALATAAITALQAAHAEADAREGREALEARTDAARRLVREKAPELLRKYDALAEQIATVIGEFEDINSEVEVVNRLRKTARLDVIADADELHRKEADRHIPERRATRKKWVYWDRHSGKYEDVGVFIFQDGQRVPSDGNGRILAGAREIDEEHVAQKAEAVHGRRLPSLHGNVRLPPGLLSAKPHWPAEA